MRLKGKALDWLHSKPEFIKISLEALLFELKSMFHHRPSRMMLRRKFEEREWKKEETFCEYMHDKVILGNRVPIDEDEIVEYIVDDIPDPILRDQARVSGLRTKNSLMEAFEKITLWDRKRQGAKSESKEKTQFRQKSDKSNNEQRRSSHQDGKNCFNCGLPDHLSKDCPTREWT